MVQNLDWEILRVGKSIKLILTIKLKMNEGPSFSFLSFSSHNYPSLTFHEIEPTSSRYQLKDSMINNLPGKKTPMGNQLEVVLLLQAAEIQRLTMSLHAYRTKFKQLSNVEKNYDSFQNQVDQLLNLKQQFQLRQKKMNNFVKSQEGSLTDMNNYLQKLQSKYKRSLKYIQEIVSTNQALQAANTALHQQLLSIEQSFEAFKQQSIRAYQQLRQQLETAKSSSFSVQSKRVQEQKARFDEIIARQYSKFKSQREKYELLLQQERDKYAISASQAERFKRQNQQYKKMMDQVSSKYREAEAHNQNSLTLLGIEIERLKGLLHDKNNSLSQAQKISFQLRNSQNNVQQEALLLKRQVERSRQKALLYEQEINKQNNEIVRLSSIVSSLSTKVNQLSITIDQKNSQIRIKENKLNFQLRTQTQSLINSQLVLNKQKQELKQGNSRLSKQLTRINQELEYIKQLQHKKESQLPKLLKQWQKQRQKNKLQTSKALQQQRENIQKSRSEIGRLATQLSNYQSRTRELTNQNNEIFNKLKNQQAQTISLKENRDGFIRQTAFKVQEYENTIRVLNEIKLNLEAKCQNLASNLQRLESQRQQSKKTKSFQQLYNQIEALCFKVLQKDDKIQALSFEVISTNLQIKKQNEQIANLKQMLNNMLTLIQSFEKLRKEDNQGLFQQIKKLFKGQFKLIQQLRQTNFTMSNSSVIQKQMIQSSHSYILKMKDMQTLGLKQKIRELQNQLSKGQNEQIISKMISVTRQCSELKGVIAKNSYQLQFLRKETLDLKFQLQRVKQNQNRALKQKDQLYRKTVSQLDEANNHLYQQKHNRIQMQSEIMQIQSHKQYHQIEIKNKQELIRDLKEQLKLQNQTINKVSLSLQTQLSKNKELNDEMLSVRKAHQLQKMSFEQQLRQCKIQIQDLRNNMNNFSHQLRQGEIMRTQLQKNSQILFNYKQRINSMNTEFNHLQVTIEDLKRINSQLSNRIYELSLMLQKKELAEQKLVAVNLELTRLQKQNLNLSQEIQACRLQICQESTQEKQLQQNNMLFVLVFAEVQSLRAQLSQKQKLIAQLRREILLK